MENQKEAKISLCVYNAPSKNLLERFFLWCAKSVGNNEPELNCVTVSIDGADLKIVTWRSGMVSFVKVNDKSFWTTSVTPVEVLKIKY